MAAPKRICMASFIFNWKRVEAESRILKQISEQRERHFSENVQIVKGNQGSARNLKTK